MAKTESTAVNELIELVQTATPLKPDPTEDLMFKAPAAKTKVSPPRVTQTTIPLPPLRSAGGDVPPLPRARAPQGTQRGVPSLAGDKPPAKPSVRMSTAAPSRGVTIPPINRTTRAMSPPPVKPWAPAEGTGQADALPEDERPTPAKLDAPAPLDTRPTRPSLPPPIRKSVPPATSPSAPSTPRMTVPQRTDAPPQTPVAAPFETPIYPSAAPYLAHVQPDMTSHQAWFDQSGGFAQPVEVPVEVEINIGTAPVRKPSEWKALLPKLIAPTIGFVLVGILVGGYFAFTGSDRDGGTKVTAPEAAPGVAATDEKAEPVVKAEAPVDEPKAEAKLEESKATPPAGDPEPTEPVAKIAPEPQVAPAAIAGKPTFVDVRIDSKPAGATVMLVDRGKTMFLGTTPISTAIDPSRQYDLVFTYSDKPTLIEHLDPSKTNKVSVTLGGKVKAEAPKAAVKKGKVKAEAPKAAVKKELPRVSPPKVEPKKEVAAAPTETKAPPAVIGAGVLMVSSKPPTEIYIDGVPTGLSTPQRAMKLPVGKHRITLVNQAEKIRKTIPINITADQPTKVIENFMK